MSTDKSHDEVMNPNITEILEEFMEGKKVYVYEMGEFHESANDIRIFSSLKKAINQIPKEFKEIPYTHSLTGVCYWYGETKEDDKGRQYWLSITEYTIK